MHRLRQVRGKVSRQGNRFRKLRRPGLKCRSCSAAAKGQQRKSRLQRCIVHQIRSSTKYVSYKDIKQLVADLKKIYTAVTEEEVSEEKTELSVE